MVYTFSSTKIHTTKFLFVLIFFQEEGAFLCRSFSFFLFWETLFNCRFFIGTIISLASAVERWDVFLDNVMCTFVLMFILTTITCCFHQIFVRLYCALGFYPLYV